MRIITNKPERIAPEISSFVFRSLPSTKKRVHAILAATITCETAMLYIFVVAGLTAINQTAAAAHQSPESLRVVSHTASSIDIARKMAK